MSFFFMAHPVARCIVAWGWGVSKMDIFSKKISKLITIAADRIRFYFPLKKYTNVA